MAYAVIQFKESGRRVATLVRRRNGQPTGADGVNDPLSRFIEQTSPTLLRQGSPGALYMAELFTAREVEAGREVHVLGADGPMGIAPGEMDGLEPPGWLYEVTVGPEGDRTPPQVHVTPLARPPTQG